MTEKLKRFLCELRGHSYRDADLRVNALGGGEFLFRNSCARCGAPYMEVVRIPFPWKDSEDTDDPDIF